jgi:hypothetical protein
LQDDEWTGVLTRKWRPLGLDLEEADFTDAQYSGHRDQRADHRR